uniref:Uncharacterized protein n=1 Tax=Glossina morsitans morsitans TaxID=37546 RepID=A0A1B0G2P5_GLOMM
MCACMRRPSEHHSYRMHNIRKKPFVYIWAIVVNIQKISTKFRSFYVCFTWALCMGLECKCAYMRVITIIINFTMVARVENHK